MTPCVTASIPKAANDVFENETGKSALSVRLSNSSGKFAFVRVN